MTEQRHKRPEVRAQWSSETAFIFSMAAAAVGLGNLWRFPYMVGENGGGAFLLAYLIALVVVAMPVTMLEIAAGRLRQGSVVTTFRGVTRVGALYGWAVTALTVVITSYYLVVTGWTLGYAIDAARLRVRPFEAFASGYASVWCFVAVTLLAAAVLLRGVRAIEAISKALMPLLALFVAGLVGYAATLEGWDDARRFLLAWEPARLADPELWIFAFGQAFFTLAIGQGLLVTYGSYMPQSARAPRATLVVAGTQTAVALMAGWMIFPLAFTFDMAPDGGAQLAFSILPRAFGRLAWGDVIAMPFFTMFFAAAFSSCLAGLKVVVAVFSEELGLSNARAVGAATGLMLALGLPSALSFTPVRLTVAGMPFLEVVDRFGGTNVVIASGVIGTALLCWSVPPARILVGLGVETPWWSRRIYAVGRALPVAFAAFLAWRIAAMLL